MLDSVNWWFFCQQVRAELKVHFVPDYPDVGFLSQYRGVALRLMHAKLCTSIAGAEFVAKLEKRWYEEKKQLLLVYAVGNSERLAQIAAAKTLTEIEAIFDEMMTDEMEKSASPSEHPPKPLPKQLKELKQGFYRNNDESLELFQPNDQRHRGWLFAINCTGRQIT